MDMKEEKFTFLEDCPTCDHYDKSNGLCRKFHYSTTEHIEKLLKYCGGRFHTGKKSRSQKKKLWIHSIIFITSVVLGVLLLSNWDTPTLGGIFILIAFYTGFHVMRVIHYMFFGTHFDDTTGQ